MSSTLAD
jgi:hypothetical protein